MEVFKNVIKNNKPHIVIKDFKKQLLKSFRLCKDHKRHNILKNARKSAHNPKANRKRNISNNMK